jgi:hypothetical protein
VSCFEVPIEGRAGVWNSHLFTLSETYVIQFTFKSHNIYLHKNVRIRVFRRHKSLYTRRSGKN